MRKESLGQVLADVDNSLKTVVGEWIQKQSTIWSGVHQKNVINKLVQKIFPYPGREAISSISAPKLLQVAGKSKVVVR